jgi:hypothetical protein
MYTHVTRDQFEIRKGVYVHKPTQAEFAPNPNSEGSLLIYTGSIGSRLANGELFDYAEVLAVMTTLWGEASLADTRLAALEA